MEIQLSFDPLVPDEAPAGCLDLDGPPWGDVDNDRLNGCEEVLLGTDDSLPDSDGDAVPDWIELALGTDYVRADGLDDSDWDGAPNGEEILNHTDPRSGDVGSHLADAYRYELVDEGVVVEPSVSDPRYILGVQAVDAGLDSAGGLGTLRLTTVGRNTPQLSWQDAQDELPGDPVNIPSKGTYLLTSSSPDLERWIIIDADPVQFPPVDAEESLLVELSERQCLQWTVRNIKLLDLKGGERGLNDVFVYFAQAPAGQLSRPGLFRVAHVPVTYREGKGRTPSAPLVKVRDEEFAPIRRLKRRVGP